MKITCQSCQSKYTIADEKIHGKVAKIRCRKCGETIEVDGTRLGAEEQGAVQPAAVQPEANPSSYEAVWTVNIADDDQRTMTLAEIVEAYHSGLITAETYLWAEGMADWAPLAEVPEVVAALGSGTPPAADDAEPVRDSMFQAPPSDYGDVPAETGSAGASDSVRPQSPPTSTPRPLGARDEQSVLFSLSALTASAPKVSVPPSSTGTTEDSGLIDLNALAAKAKAEEAAGAPAEKTTPVPMLFPAALGSVEPVTTPAQPPPPSSSSKAPIFIGAGIAIAGVAIAAVLALRPAEPPPAPTPATTAAVTAPTAAPTPEPAPTATQAEEPKAPVPAASAAPTATAEPEAADTKKPATTTSTKKPTTTTKPATSKQTSKEPAKPAAKTTSKPASTPKKSNCGCAPTDLQCQIRCSAMGK